MTDEIRESEKAVYQHTLFKRDDASFCVFVYRDIMTGDVFNALGTGLCEVRKLLVELTGHWELDKKSGSRRFITDYWDILPQTSRDGIIAFLGTLKCGIGPKKAALIYEKFGAETWSVLDKHPERLAEVSGIGEKTVDDLISALKNCLQQRKLVVLFSRANVPLSTAQANDIISKLGKDALDTVTVNPYCAILLTDGLCFEMCDALAAYLDLREENPDRLKAYVLKLLNDASSAGDVCMPKDRLLHTMADNLYLDESICKDAINAAFTDGHIKMSSGMLYLKQRFDEETAIAMHVKRLLESPAKPVAEPDSAIDEYERNEGRTLAKKQREAVKKAFSSTLSIITGGPGTGKTTVIKAVLAVYQSLYAGKSSPLLLAPTGKAARRMSEATGFNAATIHSSVGYKSETEFTSEVPFIDADLIIVDEVSMMDQLICSVLLKKIRSGTRLILCGDPDQLPSVGCGNVLLDMIKSHAVPVTELDVVYRQQGTSPIVENAARIQSGNPELKYGKTFKFMEHRGSVEIFKSVCDFYVRCVNAYGLDDVLLLNPQRNSPELSVKMFNSELQKRLNGPGTGKTEISVGGLIFREGDRVMQREQHRH